MLCGGAFSSFMSCILRRTGLNGLFCFIDWPQVDAFSWVRGVRDARWGLGQSGMLSIHIGACLGYIDVIIHQITRIMASKYGHKHVKAWHTNVAMYVLTPLIIYEMLTTKNCQGIASKTPIEPLPVLRPPSYAVLRGRPQSLTTYPAPRGYRTRLLP